MAAIYIVYMGDILKGDFSASSLHTSMLEEVVGSYQRSFNGFVAKLTEEEKKKLAVARMAKEVEETVVTEQEFSAKDYHDPPPAPLVDVVELTKWSFYRAIIAEFIATLLFLYITVLTVIGYKSQTDPIKNADQCGGVGILGIAWAFGGMIFVLVYCTAGISGEHINPAVTFGLFLARKVSLIRALLYMVAQCAGAICGVGLVKAFQRAMMHVRHRHDSSPFLPKPPRRPSRLPPPTTSPPPSPPLPFLPRPSSPEAPVAATLCSAAVITDFYVAKLAEQAERYDEMVDAMKKVATLEPELTEICGDIMTVIDEHLIPSCSGGESTVFYYKMKGDYYRYLAEFKAEKKEAADLSLKAELRHGVLDSLVLFEKGMEGVVSVIPNEKRQLLTTRSWDFMGFPQEVKRVGAESNIIVGMLDTGIWPESDSFSDDGFGPPPSKWNGTCQSSSNFTCNNKIIGAKYYRIGGKFAPGDFQSPRDSEGHGSHTSSTAAGRLVSNTSLFGLASGTARGAVPSARIAVYKICWSDGCNTADILAAFDDAIADGVDLISLSVGGFIPLNYFDDVIAIGAFHSMKNGILTSNSAGNSGPSSASIKNFSPWSLSVAASTIDRKFVTKVMLGNNMIYEGISINTFDLNSMYPLIYGGDAPNTTAGYDGSESRYCYPGSLNTTLVNGTIVLCDQLHDGTSTLQAGAIGTVMQGDRFKDVAFLFPLSASYMTPQKGSQVSLYINSTSNPTANIAKSIERKDKLAPFVVSFSSRGPNPITTDILKPDLTAPGVDILAAWSEATTATGIEGDTRVVPYNIISGTSMSCPHAAGAAAYVKSFNPEWSPAAIKSALMTTASPMSVETNSDAEFAYGAGHIDPVKAANPGLVYDIREADYVTFLCGQGYSNKSLSLVTGDNSTTCTKANNGTVWDLNMPSFALSTQSSAAPITRVFHRTVTNFGSPVSVYQATVVPPPGLEVRVDPSVLTFKSLGQKQSFVVTVNGTISKYVLSGSLVWDDGVYQVRSPIVASLN
ncbi:unnamed protein product [Camellia sinensis]